MPFGLKNAEDTFVRAMEYILRPIKQFSDSYVDDLFTFSDDFQLHLTHLREFLRTIRFDGLTLNFKKCHYAKQKVKYPGYIIGCNSHQPDPKRL